MKPEELMIGDWVRLRHHNSDGKEIVKNFQVTEIRIHLGPDDYYIWGERGNMGKIDDIEPVLITSEILEQNGWENIQGMYLRLAIGGSQYVEWYSFMGRVGRYYKYKDGHEDIIFCVDGIYYIHQLQHALRLCGVKKKTEL